MVACPMIICPPDPTPALIDNDVTAVSFTMYIPLVKVPPAKEMVYTEECNTATTALATEYAVLACWNVML